MRLTHVRGIEHFLVGGSVTSGSSFVSFLGRVLWGEGRIVVGATGRVISGLGRRRTSSPSG